MSGSRIRWPLLIVGSVAAAAATMPADDPSLPRTLIVLWFLLVCPGRALVLPLGLADPWSRLMLATALSVSLDIAVAGTLSYAGVWSPETALAILMAVTLGGVAAALLRRAPQ